MADPTSMAVAGCAATTSCLAVVATAAGVPVPMVIAALLGAAVSVSQQPRVALNVRSLTAASLTLALSVAVGIWGGSPAGRLMVGLINALLPDARLHLGADACDPFATLLLAMIGVPVLLPIALGALRSRFNVPGPGSHDGDAGGAQ